VPRSPFDFPKGDRPKTGSRCGTSFVLFVVFVVDTVIRSQRDTPSCSS